MRNCGMESWELGVGSRVCYSNSEFTSDVSLYSLKCRPYAPFLRFSLFFFLFFLFSLLFPLFFFLSCKTAPQKPDEAFALSGYVPLDAGASVCVFADVAQSKPLLNNMSIFDASNKQLQQMLDKTLYAVAAMYAPPNSGAGNMPGTQPPRRYQLAAWGNYPSSMAKMALGAGKDWKKKRSPASGAPYWYAENSGLSVAVHSAMARVSQAAGNTPTDPFSTAPGTPIPEGFNSFRQGAALSCWIENPGPIITKWLDGLGIPLEFSPEQMFINFFAELENGETRYRAIMKLQVSSEGQARTLVNLFSFARLFISPGALEGNTAAFAAIFFANPPEQESSSLLIKTKTLSSAEMALLFAIISL